ncbi:hypothetical protein TWF694_010134 [Orbilia ellipsospora]|uniref:Uncharacterized protein n=1 Tax=Orbilia ellipsospora TaxID=2528407 RepID=A0AAV9X8Y8_9PEZI
MSDVFQRPFFQRTVFWLCTAILLFFSAVTICSKYSIATTVWSRIQTSASQRTSAISYPFQIMHSIVTERTQQSARYRRATENKSNIKSSDPNTTLVAVSASVGSVVIVSSLIAAFVLIRRSRMYEAPVVGVKPEPDLESRQLYWEIRDVLPMPGVLISRQTGILPIPELNDRPTSPSSTDIADGTQDLPLPERDAFNANQGEDGNEEEDGDDYLEQLPIPPPPPEVYVGATINFGNFSP